MKYKKTLDARKLPREAKEQLRMAAVKRVESGESPELVAEGLGINRRVIVKSDVSEVESSGGLIGCCHLDTIFEFDSGYHLRQVIETT